MYDVREPVRYPAASGGTVVAVLLSSASAVTGTLAALAGMGLPTWVGALIVVAVVAVLGWAVAWALRAGTTLDREHLRIAGAFTARTVPWRAIGAVGAGAPIVVLVDGEWLALTPGPDAADQYRTVHGWWTARRGVRWRAPAQVPPTPWELSREQMAVPEPDRPLRGWWGGPLLITGMLVAPIALGIGTGTGFRVTVTIIGWTFAGTGAISVVAHVVGALRRRVPVPVGRLLLALAVLAAALAATWWISSLIPEG